MSPPRAVVEAQANEDAGASRNMDFRSNPDSGRQSPRSEESTDDGGGESYFARELQELRSLPADSREGKRGKYQFRTGATYQGQWKGNMRHGVGIQKWVDGATFIGQWVDSYA